jgi:hypothetical protein
MAKVEQYEVRRIPLPRTTVNKALAQVMSCCYGILRWGCQIGLSLSASPEVIAVTQIGRQRWGAYCEGVVSFVAEGDLCLTPAVHARAYSHAPAALWPGLPKSFEPVGSVRCELNGYHNGSRQCPPRVLDDSSAATYVVYLTGSPTDSCVEP